MRRGTSRISWNARAGAAALLTVTAVALAAAGAVALTAGSLTSGAERVATQTRAAPQSIDDLNAPYDGRFHFVRVRYDPYGGQRVRRGRFGGREPMWAHDYPRGERNFMKILEETTYIHPLVDGSNILTLDDPRLFQYPVAYIIEVSAWDPTDAEVAGLREYLLKGGFLIVDDFRGYQAMDNLEFQMGRVLPGVQFIQLDASHEIFDSFFRIDPHKVVPPYGPQDPQWYGVFEDNDPAKRLMVIANYDNDISEYWEWSDQGFYGIDLTNEAYKLGVNYIVYGMTH